MRLFKKKQIVSADTLNTSAVMKFLRHKTSLISVIFIGIVFLLAVLGYAITPDSTPYANTQILEIATQKPGFFITFLEIDGNEPNTESFFFKKMLFGEKSNKKLIPIESYQITDSTIEYRPYSDETVAKSSTQSIPFSKISTHDKGYPKQKLIEEHIVKKTFWLGTDSFGRDYLSQLIIGARVSLSVGIISVMISLFVGVLLGSLAGYFKGWIDNLIMWFINVVWSIPTLLLVIAITFALGKGFWQVFIAIGLTMWVEVARVVRGQIISIRELEYVEAARALGYKNSRIIFKHILPNITSSIIILSAANFASAILIEAGLSFLGIGIQPPIPSWGMMIKENYRFIILDSAYLAFIPGLAIMFIVLAFMVIGNQLRDVLNVKEQ